MKLTAGHIKTCTVIIITILGVLMTLYLPISAVVQQIFGSISSSYLASHRSFIIAIEDYTKSTLIFVILIWMFFHLYKNYKTHINTFLKKHFLIIKGFGILYVAILAIVPVLKSSLNAYVQMSPYHHIFIFLVIIIVFFCVFISSFEEDVMNKQFRITELFVCFFLCLMGLGLFFFLMNSPN